MELAQTLTPNRQCCEAVLKWVRKDGLAANFMLKIRDRTYNLSDAITAVRKTVESFTAQSKENDRFQNIVEFFFDYLRSPEGQVLKQRRGLEVNTYPNHWEQALKATCLSPFKNDERMSTFFYLLPFTTPTLAS